MEMNDLKKMTTLRKEELPANRLPKTFPVDFVVAKI